MYTPIGTLYWRALHRVERRAARTRNGLMSGDVTGARTPRRIRDEVLLREAVRTANRLFLLAYGRH